MYSADNEDILQTKFDDAVVKNDYERQAIILVILGDNRLEKAIALDNEEMLYLKYHAFVKSAALYNAALIRLQKHNKYLKNWSQKSLVLVMEAAVKLRISLVEQTFLKGLGKAMITSFSYLEKNEEHKKRLIEIREEAKHGIDTLDNSNPYTLMNKLNMEVYYPYEQSLKNKIKKIELKRAEEIKKQYFEITHQMQEFIRSLLDECISIVGSPPCSYTILSLGSMARSEMTPYSDLEWAVLIDDIVEKKRFEIQIRGGKEESEGEERAEYESNIDQEIQDITAEQELNKQYFRKLSVLLHLKIINLGETPLGAIGENWLEKLYKGRYSDYDELACGFCFDGQFERACKTPLGNMHTNKIQGKFELIGTIDELARFQSKEWQQNDRLLVVELAGTDLISGDAELIREYRKKIANLESIEVRKHIGFDLLNADVAKFKLKMEGINEGKSYEIKPEIYRFIDRIIENLALVMNYVGSGITDKIEQMEVFNEAAIRNFKVALGIGLELRLRVYLHYDRRAEEAVIIIPERTKIENQESLLKRDKFYIPDIGNSFNIQMLFRYYYTALPLQHELSNIDWRSFLSIKDFYEENYGTKGLIYNRLARYEEAIYNLEKILFEPFNDYHIYIRNVLGNIYAKFGKTERAVEYYIQCLSYWQNKYGDIVSSDITIALNNLGEVYSRQGNFDKAIQCFEDSFKRKKEVYKNSDQSDAKTILEYLNNPSKSKEEYENVIQDYLKGSENTEIAKETASHFDIVVILHNLGRAYKDKAVLEKNQKEYDIALQYYVQSLDICKIIYKKTVHHDIPIIWSSLGNLYKVQKTFDNAIKCHAKSLEIYNIIYQNSIQFLIAGALNDLALVYYEQKNFDQALKLSTESFEEAKKHVSEDLVHPVLGKILNSLGTICREIGKVDEAIKYHMQSVKISKEVYKDKAQTNLDYKNEGLMAKLYLRKEV